MLAAITAPLAVVPISVVRAVWYFATSPRSTSEMMVFPDPDAPWEFVALFSMYGVPTAYVSLAIFLPLYFLTRRITVVSYPVVMVLGLVTCFPASLFYGHGGLVRTLIFLLPYGAAVAALFLWMVRRRSNQSVHRSFGDKKHMPLRESSIQPSIIVSLIALGFFAALLLTSLSTPGVWTVFIYGGILLSSLAVIVLRRREQRGHNSSSAIALWIVGFIVILFVLLALVLPTLG